MFIKYLYKLDCINIWLYPWYIVGHLGIHPWEVLPATSHSPADHARQVDPVGGGLYPHEWPPAVSLTRVLALQSPGTHHVGCDLGLAQGGPALVQGHQGEAHLLQDGGQGERSLLCHAPTSHCQWIVHF